jgi:hypothetical protein
LLTTRHSPDGTALSTALWFAYREWPVLPLHGIVEGRCTCGTSCASPGKHPVARFAPHGLKDASTDEGKIREWFAAMPNMNYGVRCDEFVIIDVDPRANGRESWRKVVSTRNGDPHSWRALTGGGGFHLYLAMPTPPVKFPAHLATGVDVKAGPAAYVVGPGCSHTSGKLYRWYEDASPTRATLLPTPEWLIKLAAKKAKASDEPRDRSFYDGLVAPAKEGQRTTSMAALLGHLFGALKPDRRVLTVLALAFNQQHYSPPLDDEKVLEIARNLAALEDKKGGRK